MSEKRTLYECLHARVLGQRIYCERGYPLSTKSGIGSLEVKRLARGEPLKMDICQSCPDFDRLGPPVPAGQRGWSKNGKGGK